MKYRVSIEHKETYIVDASCAAEAQFVAADFSANRGNSECGDQVLEHAEEVLTYTCVQIESCLHARTLGEDQLDA